MGKWVIQPAPSIADPQRHVLFFQGERKEVLGLIKKFGLTFGRPQAVTTPEGFNFRIYLHDLTKANEEEIAAALNGANPAAPPPLIAPKLPPPVPVIKPKAKKAASPPKKPASAPKPVPAPAPKVPPPAAKSDSPVNPPSPAVEKSAPPSGASPKTDVPAQISPPVAEIKWGPAETADLPGEDRPLLAAAPAFDPTMPPPVTFDPGAPPNFASAAAPDFSAVPETRADEPMPAPAPAPAPKSAPAVQTGPLEIEDPIDPTRSLDTLLIGPYNRFAQGAAASIIDAPASLYNPLFLYGPAGSGKTHLIQAIAVAFKLKMPPGAVVLTSGFKLSRAVDGMIASGKPSPIAPLLERIKVLLVDDIHLMEITENNKADLAQLFTGALKNGCQIVVTSLYSPKALGSLEEALKISFAKGWCVDLKVPPGPLQIEIMQSFCRRRRLALNPDEIERMLKKFEHGYGETKRWIKRLAVFKELRQRGFSTATLDDLLAVLLDPKAATPGELPDPEQIEAASGFVLPQPPPGAKNLAVLFPQGQDVLGGWMLSRFHQVGIDYAAGANYRLALKEGYDSYGGVGVPFQIGRACLRAQVQAALIVGPPDGSPLAGRSEEFAHAIDHVLKTLGIGMGWIAPRKAASPVTFLYAHLDLMAPAYD